MNKEIKQNNKTIENLFSSVSNSITVPSYSDFSQAMNRPIRSPVTNLFVKRKTHGWILRGFIMASIAVVAIAPMIYSRQGTPNIETQVISDEADRETALLDQEDMLIGKSVDAMFNQLFRITS
jgi:magnesium-transporting ATPase (P-type)